MLAVGLKVSEKNIFFHYKSIGSNDPVGPAKLDPNGMVGTIYVGDHQTLLQLNIEAVGLMVSEKKIF